MFVPSYYVEAGKKRRKFTSHEDSVLLSLVQSMGAREWNNIARYMPERTGRQCRDRYYNYLRPGFTNVNWTREEDQILIQQYQIVGPSWSNIEKHLPGRSANSIKNRWNYYITKHLDELIPNLGQSTSVGTNVPCRVESSNVKHVESAQSHADPSLHCNERINRTSIFNIDMSDLESLSDCPPVFSLMDNEYFTVI